MYDYRKDIIDIIKGTNPSIEGIEAVQSIVNPSRHQSGYQNPMSAGLPSEPERNEETIEPLETSSPSDTAIEQNEAKARPLQTIKQLKWLKMRESTQTEQDEAPASTWRIMLKPG